LKKAGFKIEKVTDYATHPVIYWHYSIFCAGTDITN